MQNGRPGPRHAASVCSIGLCKYVALPLQTIKKNTLAAGKKGFGGHTVTQQRQERFGLL